MKFRGTSSTRPLSDQRNCLHPLAPSFGWRARHCSLRTSQPGFQNPCRYFVQMWLHRPKSLNKATPSCTSYFSQQAADISIVAANHRGSTPIATHRLRQARPHEGVTVPHSFGLTGINIRVWRRNDREQSILQLELAHQGRDSKQRWKRVQYDETQRRRTRGVETPSDKNSSSSATSIFKALNEADRRSTKVKLRGDQKDDCLLGRGTHHPDDGGSKHLWKSANVCRTTRRKVPEDSHLHIRHCKNLKPHRREIKFRIYCYHLYQKLLSSSVKKFYV
jgi:hypothetical protein